MCAIRTFLLITWSFKQWSEFYKQTQSLGFEIIKLLLKKNKKSLFPDKV